MLAKNPIISTAAWIETPPYSARFVDRGITLAIVDRSCGRWDGRIEQAVIAHHSKSSRTSVGGLTGYTSRIAAQIAVEDFLYRRMDDATSDAAALGREALASTAQPHDEYDRGFHFCAGM